MSNLVFMLRENQCVLTTYEPLNHFYCQGMGIHDPRYFDFLTPPSTMQLLKAFELLYTLGAFDKLMLLTEHGKQMAKFPLDPIFAHLLLQSQKYECTKEILTVVAMLSTENVFYRPGGSKEITSDTVTESKAVDKHRRFRSHEGDLPTLVSFL
jgi:HrpA-like RNA helicase